MLKLTGFFACLLLVSANVSSQNIWELGGEYQYHCGRNLSQHDIGIRYDGFQARSSWNVGVSYNFGHTKTKDGGKESGIGISAGYRYGFNYNPKSNFSAGLRFTFEFDKWADKDGKSTSKETVFIPQAELGYQHIYGTLGHFYTTPAIGYGYGIKLNAEGEEKKADEGGRFITGISLGYRF
jgi:hypothetical protein